MEINESQIAALEAANIALGELPTTGSELNEMVWNVFRAGMRYKDGVIVEHNLLQSLLDGLRSIEFAAGEPDEVLGRRCQVCAGWEHNHHMATCWLGNAVHSTPGFKTSKLGWLAALLIEEEE